MTRRDLVAALKAERAVRSRSPNVEVICRAWPDMFRKVALAEALWPRLQAKVRRDAHPVSACAFRLPASESERSGWPPGLPADTWRCVFGDRQKGAFGAARHFTFQPGPASGALSRR